MSLIIPELSRIQFSIGFVMSISRQFTKVLSQVLINKEKQVNNESTILHLFTMG